MKSNLITKVKLPRAIAQNYGLKAGEYQCQICGDFKLTEFGSYLLAPYGVGVVGTGKTIMCDREPALERLIWQAVQQVREDEKTIEEKAMEALEGIYQ